MLPLVAGDPQQALRGREGGVSLRGVRPRLAARAAARAHPSRDLPVLRSRAADVGPVAARRSADRGRDDGRGGGTRLLRRLHRVLTALSRRRAGVRGPAAGSTRRAVSALTSAPRSNAIAASHSHVSVTITAASDPHVLLYEPKLAV